MILVFSLRFKAKRQTQKLRGSGMDDPKSQIGDVLNTRRNQMSQIRTAPKSQANLETDNNESSSKYRIESNLIVYEKYDRNGKLIFRVPWSFKSIDEKV